VDIVSVSFRWLSFDSRNHGTLQVAINKEYGKEVVFAAAANTGDQLVERVLLVARRQVIHAHSTNTYGATSQFGRVYEPHVIKIATVGVVNVLLLWQVQFRVYVESYSVISYPTPPLFWTAVSLIHY